MRGFIEFDNVECIRETDAAILVVIDGEEVWLPQSCVADESEVYQEGHTGTLVITEWIAKQKNLV